MAVTPLNLNNGTNPAPAATNTITLREFNGGPIAQPDAEANFVNLTDRINDLITEVGAVDGAITNLDFWNISNAPSKIITDITSSSNGISWTYKDGTQSGGGGSVGFPSFGGLEKIVDGYYSVDTLHQIGVQSNRDVLLTMGFTGGNAGNTSVYGEFQYGMGPMSMQMGAIGTGDIWVNAGIDYQVYFSPTNQYFLAGTSTAVKLHFRCNQTNLVGHYGVPSGKNFWVTAFYVS